ncbi:GTPase ObgE/CgtA [Buchnera aphidicola (Pterocallis alni)]|uniref:Obg family GTPase CgtA n=1 Tax=Buchnera aphidicola TaxID=9 RepID=UPI0034640388
MKFIDMVKIHVTGGNGGNGCINFRREKFEPKGGPNGGDGGNGGNIWIKIDKNLNTLVDFRFKKHIYAQNGQPGQPNNKSGKNGSDIILFVPIGTRIINELNQEIITDLNTYNNKILIAKGGAKGIGNNKFKSSINRTPYQRTKGKIGESKYIQLKLLLIADVGIVGLPNSGKSTLLTSISQAKSKIGPYPFTTIIPILGTVKVKKKKKFIIADVPGIMNGASKGQGLGIQFLQHLEKCNILLHLIDIYKKFEKIIYNIQIIEQELQKYNKNLWNKPRWFIFNKIDKYSKSEIIYIQENIKKKINIQNIFYFISAKKKIHTTMLCNKLVKYLNTSIY